MDSKEVKKLEGRNVIVSLLPAQIVRVEDGVISLYFTIEGICSVVTLRLAKIGAISPVPPDSEKGSHQVMEEKIGIGVRKEEEGNLYFANVAFGAPGWFNGSGFSVEEAIGDFIRRNQTSLNIEVVTDTD